MGAESAEQQGETLSLAYVRNLMLQNHNTGNVWDRYSLSALRAPRLPGMCESGSGRGRLHGGLARLEVLN